MQHPDLSKYQYPAGESALLVHLLQNKDVDDITNRGGPHLFYNENERWLYELCHNYATSTGKGHVRYRDILEMAKAQGRWSAGIEEYITTMATTAYTELPTIDYAIATLMSHHVRRQTISQLYQGLIKAQDDSVKIDEAVADTEEALVSINKQGRSHLEVIMGDQLVLTRRKGLERRRDTIPVLTGWEDFDKHLSHGFAPTKQSIIAGRTSMGKSFFKTNVICNMALQKVGILNICPEQGFDSEHDRIDAIMTGISLRTLTRIRDLEAGHPHFATLKANSERISKEWNYACVPSRNITVPGIQAAIRRAKRGGVTPQIVFIDLFDRLDDVNVARDRTGVISSKLNELAKIGQDEYVHMCLLVQVNRGTEGRKDHRPNLSDLRDCGNFEQDSDLVMMLYREGYYNRGIEDNFLEVNIAKQRDGHAGVTYNFVINDKHTLSIMPFGEKKVITADAAAGH